MDRLSFFASLIDSIAWPGALIVIVLSLRKALEKLLTQLTRFRYGDIELDFGREVRKLEDSAKTLGLKPSKKSELMGIEIQDSAQIIGDAARLADEFPMPAIGLAWTAVEHELTMLIERFDISMGKRRHYAVANSIRLLHKRGHLDDNTRELLDHMRHLRNFAVHTPREQIHIPPQEAHEYIALSQAMIDKLKDIREKA